MARREVGTTVGKSHRSPLRCRPWLAGAAFCLLFLSAISFDRQAGAAQEGTKGTSSRADAATYQDGKALAAFLRSSAALVARAAGRADGLDFEIVVDHEVTVPIAWFESPRRARIAVGMLRALDSIDEWAALLAHLEAVYEQEYGPRAVHRRFRVRTAPPSDSLFRSGSPDLNNRIARRSNEAAIETLNRRRLTMLSDEERAEQAMRIDASALEILRAGRIGGMALRRLYARLQEAGGGMVEDAGDDGRRLAARHLSWLAQLPLADRPLPAEWRELVPLFGRARAALGPDPSESGGSARKP